VGDVSSASRNAIVPLVQHLRQNVCYGNIHTLCLRQVFADYWLSISTLRRYLRITESFCYLEG
jgi:hypothetical protein